VVCYYDVRQKRQWEGEFILSSYNTTIKSAIITTFKIFWIESQINFGFNNNIHAHCNILYILNNSIYIYEPYSTFNNYNLIKSITILIQKKYNIDTIIIIYGNYNNDDLLCRHYCYEYLKNNKHLFI